MFLKEFETHKEKFDKIQTYLKENYKMQIAEDKMTSEKATRLIRRSEKKLKEMNQQNLNTHAYYKIKLISEGLKIWKLREQEETSDMEEARVLLAAEEVTEKLQDIIEKVAELQVQKMIPIVDKMKEELGPNEAARFNEISDSSLGELLSVAKATKDKISSAIVNVSNPQSDMAQNDGSMSSDMGMGPDSSMTDPLGGDETDGFGGDDAVSGEIGPEGREMKG